MQIKKARKGTVLEVDVREHGKQIQQTNTFLTLIQLTIEASWVIHWSLNIANTSYCIFLLEMLLQKGVYKNHACARGDNNMGPLQGLCTPDTEFPIGRKTTVTVEN